MKQYRKKPVVVEAIQLTEKNIMKVYKFIHGEDSVKLINHMASDRWEMYEEIVVRDGMRLKTPESGEGMQIASIGDYIVKGYSEKLGNHFWPVKPDYFEQSYDLVEVNQPPIQQEQLNQEVFIEVSVSEELPPLNVEVLCGSVNDYRGGFTFRNEGYRTEMLHDYGITHWLKKKTISELLNQSPSTPKEEE